MSLLGRHLEVTQYPLDLIFHRCNMTPMEWEVEYTDEFNAWWETLTEGQQEDVAAVVGVLEKCGPSLRRPYVGTINGSRHSNMKELVVQHAGRPYRILFAFDPR